MSGASLAAMARPMRSTMWSSTRRIRILDGVLIAGFGIGGGINLNRYGNAHLGSLPGRASNAQVALHLRRARAHAAQAEVTDAAGEDLVGREAATIVLDGEADRRSVETEHDPH